MSLRLLLPPNLFVVVGVFLFAADASAQLDLPGEDVLPGQPIKTEEIRLADLPDETALPGDEEPDEQKSDNPDASDGLADKDLIKLPSESDLPDSDNQNANRDGGDVIGDDGNEGNNNQGNNGDENDPNADNEPGNPLEIEQSPDAIPWLRLTFRGHTAKVRALTFTPNGQRMITGGDDKSVIVWRKQGNRWQYERTIRWRIQRGQSGRIYALAATDDLLAIAGHGGMSNVGEIILVDPKTGQQKAELFGHPQVVVSLAFSSGNNPMLASMDVDGRLLRWSKNERGQWQSTTLAYDKATAEKLRLARRIHPLAFAGRTVVAPQYAGNDKQGNVIWRIRKFADRPQPIAAAADADPNHRRLVTAMAIDRSGNRMATADDFGRVFVWDLKTRKPPLTKQFNAPVTSVSFDRTGRRLGLVIAPTPAQQTPLVQWYDPTNMSSPQGQKAMTSISLACGLSPDAPQIAFTQGNSILVRSLDGNGRQSLQASVRVPTRVAFPVAAPYHQQIYFSTKPAVGKQLATLESGFDTQRLRLVDKLSNGRGIVPPNWKRGEWRIATRRANNGSEEYYLTFKGQRRASIPWNVSSFGIPTAFCWIPNFDGKTHAVAIGASGNGNIYVFKLAEEGKCPLIRQFRGHEGPITSIAVSLNLTYLASGSEDATVRVWSLDDLFAANELSNRWGAEFDENDDGQLIVSSIRKDGPLYFRGVREGDVIQEVGFQDNDQTVKYEQPRQMLKLLSQHRTDQTIYFKHTRIRGEAKEFVLYPAWQQVASLFVDQNREWAYWAPAGFYAASFEGHKLFGWLVNRMRMAPDFFLAAQVQQTLERPRVMSRLLAAGNLSDAFKRAGQRAPANANRSIINGYRLKPRIVIHTPTQDEKVDGGKLTVEATIATQLGSELVPPKAFANGVAAVSRKLLETKQVANRRESRYRWNLRTPSDKRVLVQVVAATEAKLADVKSVVIQQDVDQPVSPRLFVASAGINNYVDGQVPSLQYGVRNATTVSRFLESRSSPLYQTRTMSLLDKGVTRTTWELALENFVEELKREASPDDVLVLFLSGHGVRDDETNEYYYVTADARYSDIVSRRYGQCISFDDLAKFEEVPCRKLVVLDTCHSGAVQELSQAELKSALRALQNDVVFTLTATEGGSEAVEDNPRKLSVFTHWLLRGLQGEADRGSTKDGIVSFGEVADYVRQQVPLDEATQRSNQFPTVGPSELLPYANVPLTKVRNVQRAARR